MPKSLEEIYNDTNGILILFVQKARAEGYEREQYDKWLDEKHPEKSTRENATRKNIKGHDVETVVDVIGPEDLPGYYLRIDGKNQGGDEGFETEWEAFQWAEAWIDDNEEATKEISATQTKYKKQWKTNASANTCPACKALNGQVVASGEKFKEDWFEGSSPPAHDNCKCEIESVATAQRETADIKTVYKEHTIEITDDWGDEETTKRGLLIDGELVDGDQPSPYKSDQEWLAFAKKWIDTEMANEIVRMRELGFNKEIKREMAGEWNYRYDNAQNRLKKELDQGVRETARTYLGDILKRARHLQTFINAARREGYTDAEIEAWRESEDKEWDKEIYGSKEMSDFSIGDKVRFDLGAGSDSKVEGTISKELNAGRWEIKTDKGTTFARNDSELEQAAKEYLERSAREIAKEDLGSMMKKAGNFNTFFQNAKRAGYTDAEIEEYLGYIKHDMDLVEKETSIDDPDKKKMLKDLRLDTEEWFKKMDKEVKRAKEKSSSNAMVHDSNYDPEWDVNYESIGGGRYRVVVNDSDLGEANSIQEAKRIVREYMDEQRYKHGE